VKDSKSPTRTGSRGRAPAVSLWGHDFTIGFNSSSVCLSRSIRARSATCLASSARASPSSLQCLKVLRAPSPSESPASRSRRCPGSAAGVVLPDQDVAVVAGDRSQRQFCVNVLHENQKDVSAPVRIEGPDKFGGIDWSPSALGSPVIGGTLAHIDWRGELGARRWRPLRGLRGGALAFGDPEDVAKAAAVLPRRVHRHRTGQEPRPRSGAMTSRLHHHDHRRHLALARNQERPVHTTGWHRAPCQTIRLAQLPLAPLLPLEPLLPPVRRCRCLQRCQPGPPAAPPGPADPAVPPAPPAPAAPPVPAFPGLPIPPPTSPLPPPLPPLPPVAPLHRHRRCRRHPAVAAVRTAVRRGPIATRRPTSAAATRSRRRRRCHRLPPLPPALLAPKPRRAAITAVTAVGARPWHAVSTVAAVAARPALPELPVPPPPSPPSPPVPALPNTTSPPLPATAIPPVASPPPPPLPPGALVPPSPLAALAASCVATGQHNRRHPCHRASRDASPPSPPSPASPPGTPEPSVPSGPAAALPTPSHVG